MDNSSDLISSSAAQAKSKSLIDFPCDFPIKVMGRNDANLVPSICALAVQFDPAFNSTKLEIRPSKAGNYLGLTITVHTTSQQHLNDLYRSLSSHPLVKVVL